MMNFFEFQPNNSSEAGFSRFGVFHISWIAGTVIFSVILSLKLRSSTRKEKLHILGVLTAYMGISEIIRLIILYIGGKLSINVLPLHLCSMSVWLCIIFVRRQWDWLGQTLYSLCLVGDYAALLFPDWTALSKFNYFCWHSFIIHALTAAVITACATSGLIKPNKKAFWKPIVFLLVIIPPIFLFNRHFVTNYMFINGAPKGSPLEPLENLMGFPNYLYAYAFIIFILIYIMLCFWRKKKD